VPAQSRELIALRMSARARSTMSAAAALRDGMSILSVDEAFRWSKLLT
jgi:hypothetical protein